MDLRTYEEVKSELADVLRTVPWRGADAVRNRELFAKLAEDRFNLVVVGGYSRGKSTLMNAMLRIDRLPMGTEPLTSVITSVTYGTDERVVLHFLDTSLFLDISLDQLADYVTEHGNPGNRRRIREAEIQLPAELLRRGFRFVDTPGLGSGILENTRTTEGFLEEADAFILVSGFDGAFLEEERGLASYAQSAGRRLFVVLNKMDATTTERRKQVLEETQARFSVTSLKVGQTIFAVSARDGLTAQLRGDEKLRQASGLPEFEAALIQYLLTDRRREFLLGIVDRIRRIVGKEGDPTAAEKELDRLRDRISRIDDEAQPVASAEAPGTAASFSSCEVCEAVEQSVFERLTSLQAELRQSAQIRTDFVLHGGLCGAHARQLARITAPREICTGFAPVLLERSGRLLGWCGQSSMNRTWLTDALPGQQGCLVCEVEHRAERECRCGILRDLQAGSREVHSLSTLCIPHGLTVARAAREDIVAQAILRHMANGYARLAEDMQRFAVKQDASRRDMMSREERSAWSRGVETLVGKDNADGATYRLAHTPKSGRDHE